MVTPAEGPWKGIAIPPNTKPQTFAFVKVDLGSGSPLVLANRLLQSLYILVAGYEDCDIISERGKKEGQQKGHHAGPNLPPHP